MQPFKCLYLALSIYNKELIFSDRGKFSVARLDISTTKVTEQLLRGRFCGAVKLKDGFRTEHHANHKIRFQY